MQPCPDGSIRHRQCDLTAALANGFVAHLQRGHRAVVEDFNRHGTRWEDGGVRSVGQRYGERLIILVLEVVHDFDLDDLFGLTGGKGERAAGHDIAVTVMDLDVVGADGGVTGSLRPVHRLSGIDRAAAAPRDTDGYFNRAVALAEIAFRRGLDQQRRRGGAVDAHEEGARPRQDPPIAACGDAGGVGYAPSTRRRQYLRPPPTCF